MLLRKSLLHTYLKQQQQQQQQRQQLLLQQAQMQRQYLLQQAAVGRHHVPSLMQPGSGMAYNAPSAPVHGQVPNYYSVNQATGLTAPSKPVQMPQLMHMQSLQRVPGLVEGRRTAAEQQIAHRPGAMLGQAHAPVGGLHSFPGGGGHAQQQGMHLLPNGANLPGGGLAGQQNPTGSPLRHFNRLH